MATADFVEIVVLGIHPEDGHDRDPVLVGEPSRQADGGDRLEQREEGASEQAGLLPRDHRCGSRFAQAPGGGARRGRGAAGFQLAFDDSGHRRVGQPAAAGLECVGPGRRVRGRAGEVGGEPLEGVTVVPGETACPGELPVVYANARGLLLAIH